MKKIIFILLSFTILFSCEEKAPVQVDGKAELEIVAVWKSDVRDSTNVYSPLANAEMILVSEYGMSIEYTNENGVMHLKEIPSSIYQISARKKYPDDESILIVGNITDVEVVSGSTVRDTIFAKPISSSGISINEIYSVGPVNNIYFMFDQFLELYNSSDEIKYLDGMQVFRVTSSRAYCTDHRTPELGEPGADWTGEGKMFGVTYAFKFPGRAGEKNYPFAPRSFITLAQDAYDHSSSVSTSIDLANADWEFVNQFSAVELDNPSVPNLVNISDCKTSDFMIGITSDIMVLASGQDTVLSDGIEISTILDGIEYQTSGTKNITLDERIDRGWVMAPPKYTGRSMQRREKGVDTNDGTLDWEIIPKPTPGYQ